MAYLKIFVNIKNVRKIIIEGMVLFAVLSVNKKEKIYKNLFSMKGRKYNKIWYDDRK